MPMRARSSVVLACVLLTIYVVFWRDGQPFEAAERPIDVFSNDFGQPFNPADAFGNKEGSEHLPEADEPDATGIRMPIGAPIALETTESPDHTIERVHATGYTSLRRTGTAKLHASATETKSTIPTSAASRTKPTKLPSPTSTGQASDSLLQKQYREEYDILEQKESFGAIYGQTLNKLVGTGAHEGAAASHLTTAESGDWSEFSTTPPFKYNPYPDHNSEAWKTSSQGEYRACDGPNGPIEDLIVWSGHPAPFSESAMGSWTVLDLDSNLCFERENRLGPYATVSANQSTSPVGVRAKKRQAFNWGEVQQFCVNANEARFASRLSQQESTLAAAGAESNGTRALNKTVESRNMERLGLEEVSKLSNTTDFAEKTKSPVMSNATAETNFSTNNTMRGTSELTTTPTKRTAVLIRTVAEQRYTENDKQNIRSLIAELCLRSGGEYQVYLLVQVSDDLEIWKDLSVYQQALKDSVPEEFRSMAVIWNEAQLKKLYPLIPPDVNTSQSQWFAVQKFQIDHSEFDFFWNWGFDTRYTGHHYNLLEKLNTWSQRQPRKGIWERNERFYIPNEHHTYAAFRDGVEKATSNETIWGPVRLRGYTPAGPIPPVASAEDDNYEWGVGDDADYISLAPIFNPVNTTWPARNDLWGQVTPDTPRRASISNHSRVSRKLLDRMHIENIKGNHVASEMMPATVSLLHGYKAVFAPIPVYFDRAWSGASLQSLFNPGPKGVSGSAAESPFSAGMETRFQGASWYYHATVPMRLYRNWLGWEDTGVGGAEWEKTHGRACLPPMLLRPVRNVEEPLPEHGSKPEEQKDDYH